MTIQTTIVADVKNTSPTARAVWFTCTDHLAQEHSYGPVMLHDPAIDPSAPAVLAKVAERVAERLAEAEFEALVRAEE